MRKKNKSIIMAMAIVLAIATIASASTFAWFTASDEVTNRLRNQQYSVDGVEIGEIFDPNTPLEPNATIEKKVWTTNVSDAQAIIRLSFAELLIHLTASAAVPPGAEAATSRWSYTGTGTREFDYTTVPQVFGAAAFYDFATSTPVAPWKVFDATNFAADAAFEGTFPGTPAGVMVVYQVNTSIDSATGLPRTDVQFRAFTDRILPAADTIGKYVGKSQAVALNNAYVLADADNDGIYEIAPYVTTEIEYKYFNLITLVQNKWGALAGTTYAAFPQDQAVAADYKSGMTDASVPGTKGVIKTPADIGGFIELNFSEFVTTDLSLAVRGDWWYNAADGYFYLIDILESGRSSKLVLESITMDSAAKADYSDLAYDLIVYIEGAQPSEAALIGAWTMSATDAAALTGAFTALSIPLGA